MRRTFYPFLLASLVAGSSMAVLAQTPSQPTGTPTAVLTPKAQYDAELKQAKTRFNDDQKLCSADPDSAGRMQCKRDAQSEYDKAVAAAKGRMTAAGQPVPAAPACVDCGKVVSVKQIEKKGEGSAVGLIAGGVVGGVLGHQVGGGVGKTLATAAGAAGGAYAGREVEKKVKSKTVWKVDVSYTSGATSSYEFEKDPGYKVGDSVRRSGNSVARQ